MDCDFCNERNGFETIYNKIYGSKNRIVHETKLFSVFPCMGQLRKGHFLISSKAHKNAIGMLDTSAISELKLLIDDVANLFRNIYQQDLVCFEHGVLDDQGVNGGCGIYHMHLHLVPANRKEFSSMLKLIQSNKDNIVYPSQGLLDTRDCVATKRTYIYLALHEQMHLSDAFIITNNNNFFESQYMRKIVCKVFGKADWDWKSSQTPEETFLNTLEKGYLFFHQCISN